MITFNDVSLRRSGRLLFSDASFSIHAGQGVGLIGANGAGKSSLFAMLRGELHSDHGDVSLPTQWVTAHVAQEILTVEKEAIEYVMDGDYELRELQSQVEKAEAKDDGLQVANLYARLENIDGYNARVRAARLMSGLGFSASQENNLVKSFSGGWRMRLNLAQALMCRSDLLLLDEPTNHLDLDAVIWLEEWLCNYPGTLILISHDRDFLDHVVSHIAHLEHEQITMYTGNYSAFEKMRAEKLAQQQSAFEKQQREVAHIHSYIDRFRAQATKARQAQSRIKALQRMEMIAAAHVDSPFHFSFRSPEKIPNRLLNMEALDVGYGETAILQQIDFRLMPGDRIGLLGPNGAGKSTLIKLLAGELAPIGGEMETAKDLRIGYFAQHQLEQLHGNDTAMNHLQALDKKASEQSLKNYLGGFGFHGDRIDEKVAQFSGGEKARLVLAMLVYQRPNLLLMDEPTNHLDLEMRHALTMALQEFEGAMVVVSHDRNLLSTATDQLFLVVDGNCTEFEGDMDDYVRWLAQRRSSLKSTPDSTATETQPGNSAADRKELKREQAEQRKRLQPLKKELQKIEKRMEKLNAQKQKLEQQLADSGVYQDSEKEQLKSLLLEQSTVQGELEELEINWLEISEQLEQETVE